MGLLLFLAAIDRQHDVLVRSVRLVPRKASRLCGVVSSRKSADLSARNRNRWMRACAAPRNKTLCITRGPRPRKPGSSSAIAGSARAKTLPSINCPAQTVLGCVKNVLVWVETASVVTENPIQRFSTRCNALLHSHREVSTRPDCASQNRPRAGKPEESWAK